MALMGRERELKSEGHHLCRVVWPCYRGLGVALNHASKFDSGLALLARTSLLQSVLEFLPLKSLSVLIGSRSTDE